MDPGRLHEIPPIQGLDTLYLGAQSWRMLELTGEIADGGLPLLFPPEYFETVQGHITTGARRAGRSLEDIDVVGCIWLRARMTDEMADIAIHGTPEDCIRRLEKLVSVGLTHVRFGPPLGPDPAETIRLIGEEIIPYFRENPPSP